MTNEVTLSLDIELLRPADEGFNRLATILGGLSSIGLTRTESVPVATLDPTTDGGYRRLVTLGPYTEPSDRIHSEGPAATAVEYLERLRTGDCPMLYRLSRVVPFASRIDRDAA